MPGKPTELIYYVDPSVRDWRAKVVEVGRVKAVPGREPGGSADAGDSGPWWTVVLDRTAFYPGGGGQPADRGRIAGSRVVEVGPDPARPGIVLHYVDADAVEAVGGEVSCSLDWDRRFDFMQQHTGQHILSAVAMRDVGASTVGFHLNPATATVDLAVGTDTLASPEATQEAVTRIESAACAEVFADRPVRIHFVRPGETPADASQAGLELRIRERGPAPKGGETWRVIEVCGLDLSPCGGTHVTGSGQVGIVTVQHWEKVRDGLRLEFACGWRALGAHRWRRGALRGLANALSVHERDAASQALANLESAASLQREHRALQTELLGYQAEALFDQGEALPGGRLVVARRDDLGPDDLKGLANGICGRGRSVVLLASTGGGVPRLVFGRSDDLAHVNAGQLLSETMARLGGRGGGSPKLAQGGGGDAGSLGDALGWAAGEARRALEGTG